MASRAYKGIIDSFIVRNNVNGYDLKGTVKVSGLGGNPYRDGSFNYYMSEPVIVNDPKGMGAFLMACNEMDIMLSQGPGKGRPSSWIIISTGKHMKMLSVKNSVSL